MEYVPDYHINLIAPADLQESEYKKFHTQLGQVLEYIRVSKDNKKLEKLLKEDPCYSSMDRESADLINTITKSELVYREEGDTVNMCKAIQDMRAEAKAEGMVEGRTEGISEATVTAIKNVMESIRISADAAMDILKIDPGMRQEYSSKIK